MNIRKLLKQMDNQKEQQQKCINKYVIQFIAVSNKVLGEKEVKYLIREKIYKKPPKIDIETRENKTKSETKTKEHFYLHRYNSTKKSYTKQGMSTYNKKIVLL